MSKDAIAELENMSEQLDIASETLTKSRRPRRKGNAPAQEDVGSPPSDVIPAEVMPDGIVPADEASDVPVVELDLALLEALIFSSRHPLTSGRIGELLEVGSSKALRAAIATLNGQYESAGRAFRIEQVAGGYQMLTLPQYGETLVRFHQKEIDAKLSRSALETLAIIAYKQPVLRAEVEAIRGVASGETIRSLMEKHLVKIAGRAEEAGRPILYGTTKRFLEIFGLNSLKELPKEDQARPLPPHVSAVEVEVEVSPELAAEIESDERAEHHAGAESVREAQPVG